MSRASTGALQVAAVAGVAALVHLRSAGFGFVDLDDRDLLVEDRGFLAGPWALVEAFGRSYLHAVDAAHPYYRPLVTVSYILDTRLGRGAPAAFHLTNVALHALATALVFLVLRRLSFEPVIAGVASLFFAVHPALAAAVSWIPGRNDSLLAAFALAAWLFFMGACQDGPSGRWRNVALHLTFFALALLTKETAAVLPLLCLVSVAHPSLGHVGLRRSETSPAQGGSRRRPLPWLAMAVGWVLLLVGRAGIQLPPPMGGGAALRQAVPVAIASVGELLLPVRPSLLGDPEDLPLGRGVLALAVVVLAFRVVGPPRRAGVGLAAAAFLLFLAPALASPGTLVLESRLYLPAVGAVLLVAEWLRAASPHRRTLLAFSAATLGPLTLLTLAYEGTFRDRRSFARAAVEGAPHSAMAHVCLGKTAQLDGDPGGALAEYRTALSLGAVYVVHNNIAVIHMAYGRWAEAERELRAELAVDPASAPALHNLAIVLQHEGVP